MNDLLQTVFLSNTLGSYLWCFGSILLVYLFKRYLSKYVAGLFFRLFKKGAIHVEKEQFVNLLVGPLESFLLVFVTLVALDRLHFPEAFSLQIHKISTKQFAEAIGTAILIVTFIWMLLRMIDFIALVMKQKASLTPQANDDQMVVFFKDFFKVMLSIIGLLLIIRFSFHKDIGTLLAGLSIVAGAMALAARESLENLIASFIIFFDKPFHVGDIVKVQQITGTIEKIGLRSTRIRTEQKTFVTVPNKQMVDSVMDNISMRTQRRGDLKLELDLATTPAAITTITNGINAILKHPSIENSGVFFTDINANGYVITVEYYTGMIPINDFNALRQEINMSIVQLLKEHGVELAALENTIKIAGADNGEGLSKSKDFLS